MKKLLVIIVNCLLFYLYTGCQEKPNAWKILYVNSYHQGYAPGDSILFGIREALPQSTRLTVYYLDAKRQSSEQVRNKKMPELLQILKYFKPDIILTSDDDAVKHFVQPYLVGSNTPVVFCGVNWSAASYGLPAKNCTGMVEVIPIQKTIATIKMFYPGLKSIAILSENSVSEQRNKVSMDSVYRHLQLLPTYLLVDNFNQWKQSFKYASSHYDLIYLPTNGAISGWRAGEAKSFVSQNIKKPIITCDDFMMPYAMLGFTKVAKEQGTWVATTAMSILNGESPGNIPLAFNKEVKGWFNKELARQVAFMPDSTLLSQLQVLNNN